MIYKAYYVLEQFPKFDLGKLPHGARNVFPINAPGMDRFQLLNVGGFGLWVRVKVLGSDCNNRLPNTNRNLNHNSNDNLALNPKSNPKYIRVYFRQKSIYT